MDVPEQIRPFDTRSFSLLFSFFTTDEYRYNILLTGQEVADTRARTIGFSLKCQRADGISQRSTREHVIVSRGTICRPAHFSVSRHEIYVSIEKYPFSHHSRTDRSAILEKSSHDLIDTHVEMTRRVYHYARLDRQRGGGRREVTLEYTDKPDDILLGRFESERHTYRTGGFHP